MGRKLNPLYAACIQSAASRLGGCRALGTRLGVGSHLVELWGSGKKAVPESVFLKAVDILLEENVPPKPRPGLPKLPPG